MSKRLSRRRARLAREWAARPRPEYVTKTALAREYHLTPKMIEELGPPDRRKANPRRGDRAPEIQLYLRERVRLYSEQNAARIAEARGRREGRSAGARAAVETKRRRAAGGVAALLAAFRVDEGLSLERATEGARDYFSARYADFDGRVTPRGLCSYLRHQHTNYEDVLAAVRGKVGAGDLYVAAKLYLTALLAERFGLEVSPAEAAAGEALPRADIPAEYLRPGADVLALAARALGMEPPKRREAGK